MDCRTRIQIPRTREETLQLFLDADEMRDEANDWHPDVDGLHDDADTLTAMAHTVMAANKWEYPA